MLNVQPWSRVVCSNPNACEKFFTKKRKRKKKKETTNFQIWIMTGVPTVKNPCWRVQNERNDFSARHVMEKESVFTTIYKHCFALFLVLLLAKENVNKLGRSDVVINVVVVVLNLLLLMFYLLFIYLFIKFWRHIKSCYQHKYINYTLHSYFFTFILLSHNRCRQEEYYYK